MKKLSKVSKRKTQRHKKQKGFTLIELLVVVAIVGILSAIAIPQFAAYRARAFNASVESDARNAAAAQEAYFIDNPTGYYSGSCTGLPGFSLSGGVTCTTAGTATSFTVNTSHASATVSCTWDSTASPNMTCV